MSGYASPDCDAQAAQDQRDNAIALAQLMLPKGPSAFACQECDVDIPQKRRLAMPGCRFCVSCQELHDKKPNIKVVTKML